MAVNLLLGAGYWLLGAGYLLLGGRVASPSAKPGKFLDTQRPQTSVQRTLLTEESVEHFVPTCRFQNSPNVRQNAESVYTDSRYS
jgi:hypothetical protein